MAREPIRILLAEDNRALRERLGRLLSELSDIQVIGNAGSVFEAVTRTIDLSPDVLLLDYELPDGTGADASAVIRHVRPETKLVFLTRDAAQLSGLEGTPTIRPSQPVGEIAEVIRAAAGA